MLLPPKAAGRSVSSTGEPPEPVLEPTSSHGDHSPCPQNPSTLSSFPFPLFTGQGGWASSTGDLGSLALAPSPPPHAHIPCCLHSSIVSLNGGERQTELSHWVDMSGSWRKAWKGMNYWSPRCKKRKSTIQLRELSSPKRETTRVCFLLPWCS